MKKRIGVAWAAGMVTAAGSAAAQAPYYPAQAPPPAYGYAPRPVQTFGGPGTLVISSDMNLELAGQSTNDGGPSSWTFVVAPAADYFVIQGLSLGGQIGFTHTHLRETDDTGVVTSTDGNTFSVAARVGYDLPLGDLLSFWPKAGLLFGVTSLAGVNGNALDVVVYAPLLLHLAPHFFVGLGPGVQTDLTVSASQNGQSVQNPQKTTSYGLYFTIGGWTVPAG
jgi:hypothetical protein